MKTGPDLPHLPLTTMDTIAAIDSPEPGSDIKHYENEQKSDEFHDPSFLLWIDTCMPLHIKMVNEA
jgi:hypothetical protein